MDTATIKEKITEIDNRLATLDKEDPRYAIFTEQKEKLQKQLVGGLTCNPSDGICESCQ